MASNGPEVLTNTVASAMEKAGILIEALPYIKKFYGHTVIIKYGGHAMLNETLKRSVIQDLILMKYVGMNPIVVHGGGPEIDQMLARLGKSSSFLQGLRVTDEETMEIVEMVLGGKVNKEIVSLINQLGGKALGLSGKDGDLIRATRKMLQSSEGREYDLGFVGEVVKVNPEIITILMRQGYIPVIAPIGVGEDGKSYNINADLVAGEVAMALQAHKMVLLTDVEGILREPGNPGSLISQLKKADFPSLVAEGVISGGMIPKVECCVKAVEAGVSRAHIIDGRMPHALLLEIFTDQGVGTMVINH